MEQPQMVNFGNALSQGCFESRQGGRPENQDFAICCETISGTLMVVCDGMGGGPGGKTASSEAGKIIAEYVKNAQLLEARDKQNVLQKAIQAANAHLRQLQLQYPQLQGMGTTCVCLLYDKYSAVSAHVGDSRIYQLRFKQKHWRSWDHSVSLDRIRDEYGKTEGHDIDLEVERARTSPYNNVISRALGVAEEVKVETHELPYERGDRFALCTDGIWGSMPEKDLIRHFCHTSELGGALCWTMDSVQEIGVSEGNHHDNYTLALIEVNKNSALKGKMTHKAIIIIQSLIILCLISLVCNLVLYCSHNKDENDSSYEQYKDSINNEIEIKNKEITKLKNETVVLADSMKELSRKINEISIKESLKNKERKEEKVDSTRDVTENENISEICKSLVDKLNDIKKWAKNNKNSEISDNRKDPAKKLITSLRNAGSNNEKVIALCNKLTEMINADIATKKDESKNQQREGQYKAMIDAVNNFLKK